MAVNIFDKYGIKQVANVYFEALEDDPAAGVYEGDVVLFLDTLKVSTIETTAENVAAQGGWGNPRLIQWDYGKEINITLTDALMSLESLRFMMGGAIKEASSDDTVWVKHTAEVIVDDNGLVPQPKDRFGTTYTPEAKDKHPIKIIDLTSGTRTQIKTGTIDGNKKLHVYNASVAGLLVATDENDTVGTDAKTGYDAPKGHVLRIFWEEERTGSGKNQGAVEVTISPNTFPGTYRVVGDTFMRNTKGKDEPFQFIIERAKVQSSVTLTLEAEGDPSTFEMTLNVLRGESGDEMMKLVRYDSEGTGDTSSTNDWGSLTSSSGS